MGNSNTIKKKGNEASRLKIEPLNENFLDHDFDLITKMTAQVCGANISFLSLECDNKCFIISQTGMELDAISEILSFCNQIAPNSEEQFIVEDIRKDSRFKNPHFDFYASVPVVDENGSVLGNLFILHHSAIHLKSDQLDLLKNLAQQTVGLLSLKETGTNYSNKELNKKQLLFELTEEANKIGTWELDIDTGSTTWSNVVYQIHEVPLDFDHNKAKGIEFYHPDYREVITSALLNTIANDETFDVECILITAKGNEKWVRSIGRKIENKVVGSFQDITKIKESELKFKGIFNSTFSFIGILNTDGILLDANETALSMAGLKPNDVVGKYFWDCYWWQISKQTREELKASFRKVVSGEPVVYEVVIWIANNTPITIHFSMKPIFDSNGKVISIIPEGRPIQEIIDTRLKYKSVIESTNVGVWEWRVQTGETIFNDRWAEIVGYTLDELQPISIDTWVNLVHPDDLEESGKRLEACFEKKSEYYELEARMKHKDGHWVWVYDRGKVVEWSKDNKPIMMYGTHEDITERKQKEETLRISEEAFRGNFENAAIGMALLNQSGQWLKVNREVCEIVGYSEEELLKLTFQDITHPEDLNTDLNLLNELIKGKRSHYQMEKRYFHKDGHIVYILLAVSFVKDNEGKPLYFISQIIDISKLKETELRLSSSLAENEALLKATTQVSLISTDSYGVIKNINTGAEKILGYNNAFVKDMNILDLLFVPDQLEKAAKQLLKGSDKNDSHLFIKALVSDVKNKFSEWTFLNNDGSSMTVLLSVSEIIIDDRIDGYLFSATDISQLKFIQSQLEQKNKELEQFAHVAAHDLKEPLRGITTYLSILQKRHNAGLNDDAKSLIENAYQNAIRMKNLISDILDFSKTGEIGTEDVNLDELVSYIFSNYSDEENGSLVKLSKSKLPIIKGDPSSFIQLFTNLIDNGLKYHEAGETPEVVIDVSETQNQWCFSVADNGIGINPNYYDKVFEIFRRLHSNTEYSGTGIGLASCKKIVTAYNGEIWIEPNSPKGTIFKFTLPKN